MMSRGFKVTSGAVVALLLGLAAGCQPRNEFVSPPPPKVTVAKPVTRPVNDYVEFTGTTQATATVNLRARVNGYLRQVLFEDGATVRGPVLDEEGKVVTPGDLLFVIEPKPFRVARRSAEARLQKAEAARQLAKAEYERTLALFRRRAVSQQDVDVREAELASARADVAEAEAAVEIAEQNLDYTEVRAPISGRIGRHLVDVGNLVTAEQTLLATIESIDPIYALFYISERDLLRFMGMIRESRLPDPEANPPELEMQLADEEGFPHKGRLDYRELGVDPQTGTVMRRGIFDNPGYNLIPGLFVRIRGRLGQPEPQLLVDGRALGADQRGDYLLVVNHQDTVEYRPVTLGIAVGGMRVVREGITAEDRVIVNGLQKARPGSQVDPEMTEMQAETPAVDDGEADGDAPAQPADAQAGNNDVPGPNTPPEPRAADPQVPNNNSQPAAGQSRPPVDQVRPSAQEAAPAGNTIQ